MKNKEGNKGLRLKKPESATPLLPSYLHWYELADGYIITKEGYIQKTFRMSLPTHNQSDEKANEICTAFSRWLCSLPNDIVLNFEVSHYLPETSQYKDCSGNMEGAASKFEKLRYNAFSTIRSYVNDEFMTVVYKPSLNSDCLITEESLASFNQFVAEMKINLSSIGILIKELSSDETVTYLHSCISSDYVELKAPELGLGFDLDYILCDQDIRHDTRPLVLGDSFIKVLTVSDFSSMVTMSAMLDRLCAADIRIRWVSRYRALDNQHSIAFVEEKHKRYISRSTNIEDIATGIINQKEDSLKNVKELSNAGEMEVLSKILAETGMNIGIYSGFIVLESKDEKKLDSEIQKIKKALQENRGFGGVLVKEETLGLFPSWLGSLPGNLWHGYRQLPITSQNFSDLLRLSTPYVGSSTNEHMQNLTGCGAPLLYGKTTDGSICFFSPNGSNNDVGHTAIFGQTGSGKSILLGAMAAQFLKYPEARVILFDKDASALTNFTLNQHGALYRPLIDDTVFQPLQNARSNLSRCMRFLEAICSVQGIDLDANDREEMAKALMLVPDDHATLSVFSSLLKGRKHQSKVVAALENYTASGAQGGIFDSAADTFSPENFGKVTCVETTALMKAGDVCIVPALAYIFSQLEALFADRRPTMLVLDEAWEYLKHPYFASTIQEWLRTLRKLNVFVVLATQEISAVPQDVLKTVMASVYTSIFLPTPGADSEALRPTYESIGVTSEEIQLISRRLQPKRHYLIKQGGTDCMIADFCFSDQQLSLFTSSRFKEAAGE